MSERIYDVHDTTFELKEFEIYKFSFPQLAMVKGGNELIRYSFTTREYTYCKLGTSFALLQHGKLNELVFKGLLDLGKYYVKCTVDFESKGAEMTLQADPYYIIKRKLPDEKIINLLPETDVNFMAYKESAFLLHFVNSI